MPVVKLPLCEFGLAVLHDRGIPVSVARRNPLRAEGDVLVFPFADLHGNFNCYQVVRPHKPKVGTDGKQRKYIAPTGQPSQLYIPGRVPRRPARFVPTGVPD